MRTIPLLTRANPPASVLGSLIAIGVGLSMVAGLLFGTLVGAVYEMWRRPVAREKGKQPKQDG